MPQEISEVRQDRSYSEQVKSPVPSRLWERHREIDSARPQRTLSHASDGVSPISTPVQQEIPPIPPFGDFLPFASSNLPATYSEPTNVRQLGYVRPSKPELRVVSNLDFGEARAVEIPTIDDAAIIRKPVAVTVRSRAPTPAPTPPERSSERPRPASRVPSMIQSRVQSRVQSQLQIPAQVRSQALASTDTLGNHIEIAGGWRRPSQAVIEKLSSWSSVIVGVLLCLAPIPFFALAIGLATMDGKTTDNKRHWQSYEDLMKIAGTFFPIVFALLIGQAVIKVASYLLENGTTLQKLEQLMGSRTFCGTIGTQFQLRSFNFLGLGLVALFILSPIGSQGFLRLIAPTTTSKTSPSVVPYFTTNTQSVFAENTLSSTPIISSIIQSLYNAAVLAPSATKASSQDLWSNVKIPYQSSLASTNGIDYVPISENDTVVYTSLSGIPIGGLQTGATSLNIQSSYLELSCGSPVQAASFFALTPFQESIVPNSPPNAATNGTYYGTAANVNSNGTADWSLGLNNFISSSLNTSQSTTTPDPKFCVQITTANPNPVQPAISAPCAFTSLGVAQVEPSTLLFQAAIPSSASNSVIQAFCQTKLIYVQSEIHCNLVPNSSPKCRVTSQRLSLLPHAPSEFTPLAFPSIFTSISELLPRSFHTQLHSGSADPSLLYLINPNPSTILTVSPSLPLESLSGDIFGRRLAQLMNTFYTLSQAPFTITSPPTSPTWPTVLASSTLTAEFYKVSWPWFAVVFLATLLMFFAAILAVVLDRKTANEEVLGWVSSMLRDSKYVELGGENGGGKEIARWNGSVRVKMGVLGEGEGARVVVGRDQNVLRTRRRGDLV